MKITVDFSRLEAALSSIGGTPAKLGKIRKSVTTTAPSFDFAPGAIGPAEIIFKPKDISKLRNTSGLLTFNGKQVTLHIFQPTLVDLETLLEFPAEGPKVHFTECETIRKMRADGKFDRYVTATRTDGLFTVQPKDLSGYKQSSEKIEVRLLPCKNCLTAINYNGWTDLNEKDRRRFLDGFSFQRLYETFRFIFRCLPLYTTDTFPDGNYPLTGKISIEARRAVGFVPVVVLVVRSTPSYRMCITKAATKATASHQT